MKSIKKPKSKVRIKVSKGKLLGYHVTDPLKMRRSVLKKIVEVLIGKCVLNKCCPDYQLPLFQV